ncbi:MAG: MerR family transcriptional regulator [Lachnospiraceae bacterium]|nr:MerR family transcriptional regulator [Lachnospiraceae bacterium]
MEKRRMISDAARELDVETHVLRYWEEELDLPIPRNEMGHRYYGDKEIKLLMEVKKQKENGAQLKEIKEMVPQLLLPKKIQGEETNVIPFPSAEQNQKMEQFQQIMVKIVGQALKNHEEDLGRQMGQKVADQVVKEMDYHFREKEELEEARYQKFDEMMRSYQRARAEVGATTEVKKKRRFFGRKKRRTT